MGGLKSSSLFVLLVCSILLFSGCSIFGSKPQVVTVTASPEFVGSYVGNTVSFRIDYSRTQNGVYVGNFTGIQIESVCPSLKIINPPTTVSSNPGYATVLATIDNYKSSDNCIIFTSNEEPKQIVKLQVSPMRQAQISTPNYPNIVSYNKPNNVQIHVNNLRKDIANQFRLTFKTDSQSILFSETSSGTPKDINTATLEFDTAKFADGSTPNFYFTVKSIGGIYSATLNPIDVYLYVKSGEEWYLLDQSIMQNINVTSTA